MLLPGPALINAGGGGAEISYSTYAVPLTINGTGQPVLTSPSIPFDGGPVMVEFFIPRLTVSDWFFPALADDLGEVVSVGGTNNPGARQFYGIGRMTPTAGSRVFTMTASTGSGAATLENDAPYWLRFTKVQPATITPGAAMALLSDTVLSIATPSFDIAGIPQVYNHLLLKLALRTDEAVAFSTAIIRFNGDSAANYDESGIFVSGNGTTPSSYAIAASTEIAIADATGSVGTAGEFGYATIDIPNYQGGLTALRGVVGTSAHIGVQGTVAGYGQSVRGGSWRSTAAITRVTILPGGGSNFAAGSRVSLYGIL